MARNKRQILTEYLIHQAQRGNSRSFKQLYELWHCELFRYTSVRIQNQVIAADIVQDVWVDIAKNLRRLRDSACFPKWAFQIVVRKTANWIRKEQSLRKKQEILMSEAERTLPQNTTSQKAIDLKDDLQRVLSTLPDNQREILHLFYLSELDISEIAEIYQIPKGTVKSRLFSARASLKQVLTD